MLSLSISTLLILLIHSCLGFNFGQLYIQPSIYTIGVVAQYTIQYMPCEDNNLNPTLCNTQAVSAGADITVTFPSEYTLTSPTCISVTISGVVSTTYSCSSSGNVVTVSGAFPTPIIVTSVTLVLGNILNPVPAVATGQFQGAIGTNVAVANGGANVQLTQASFDSCSVTFNPAYVNRTGTMILTIDPRNSIGADASIQVKLPNRWANDISQSSMPITSIMSCANYSAGVALSPICAGSINQVSIVASNLLLATTTSSFSFGISQLTSPPTLQASDIIMITSLINGYAVDTCSVYVSGLIPNPFTNLVISPLATMAVNANIGIKFDITLSDFMSLNDIVSVIFPSQIVPTYNSMSYNFTSCSNPCGYLTGQTLYTNYTLKTTVINKNSVISLSFTTIKVPPWTFVTNPITVQLTRNGALKMTGTVTIQALPSSLSAIVSNGVSTVNKITNYNINITVTDGFSSSGMIQIIFPSTITPTLSTGCATMIGNNTVNTPTCTYNNIQNSITLSNMNSSSLSIPGNQTFRITVLSVKNAPSIAPSGTFSVTTFFNTSTSGLVSQGTIGTGAVTATMDIIDSSKVIVTPSSYVVSDTAVTYTISFVNGNSIPQGGYIELTVPSGVTLNIANISGYCRISLNGSSFLSTPCAGNSISGGFYVNFSAPAPSSSIAQASNISLQISSLFTNPSSTAIVSSFTLKTYHQDSYGIEQLTSGISVQMTTPSTMTSITVTRNSSTNSDPYTAYTIRVKQIPPLPSSSHLFVQFPSSIGVTGSVSCTDLFLAPLNCSVASNSITVTLTSSVSSNVQFGFIVSSVYNPPSYAPLSTSFQFTSKSSDNMISYAQGTLSSALVTTLPSKFTSIDGQFSPTIYGQATDLQITLTPSGRITPSYVLVTIPSSFTVSTLSCSNWACTSISSHLIRVNGLTSISEITFTITGIIAPIAASTDYILVSSYDSGGYKVDENSNKILFTVTCLMPCRTCSFTNTSACLSCYLNTNISSYNYLYSATNICYANCPTATYLDTSTKKCFDCNTICHTCTGTASNCTSCVSNSTYPYLHLANSSGTCRTECPLTYYPDTTQSPILCVSCIGPCATCKNSSICDSCIDGYFYYNQTCSLTCPAGITIANNGTKNCDLCSPQCATCAGNISNCVTCASTAALYQGSCVSVCPVPLVIKNGQCDSCSTACLTCSITFNNCTSCNTNSSLPYLYNFNCLSSCPIYYYESLANGLCILCSTLNIGCDNCTSPSTCGTCNWHQGYVFLTNRCYSVTPSGYYNSSGYAVACDITKDCATCEGLAINCTSCISLNLQGSQCVAVCTAGFTGINKVCVACTSNCKTCSNLQSNCTSCLPSLTPPVYLSNFECVTSCPDYTYANSSNSECTNCISPCEKCLSSTLCTSCLVGYNLLNNTCYTTCPYGYLGVNRICTRCTSPCDFCSLTLATCTSCLTGYYLVANTKTCVQTCPANLYPNDAEGACTGCQSPCVTCSTTASNCTGCSGSLNLYQSTCISNCPDGTYSLNNACFDCKTDCSTCSSATVCLTCKFEFYLFRGDCISVCPSTNPVTITGTCQACSDTKCIICDSLDQCSSCNYPTLLLSGHCLTSCPENYTSNGTNCNYDPTKSTTDNQTQKTLTSTLTSANLFPVPFTIGAAFIGIACIMSRFQHPHTFISGSLYSLWSLLEMGSIGVAAYFYYQSIKTTITLNFKFIQAFIFLGALGFLYILNIFAFIAQNCYLRFDSSFQKWQERQGTNKFFYYFNSVIGLVITHKFKNIMFSKLFDFQIFKSKLDSVQKFKIFNIFSFLSFLSSAGILFSVSLMIYIHHTVDQRLMAYIDALVLTTACIVMAIANSRKNDDFFEEKDQDGVILHKRINESDFIMKEAIVPFMEQDAQDGGNMAKRANPVYETERKFKNSMDTISDSPSHFSYVQIKQKQNISVQAAPILQDYSRIKYFDDDVSDLSMFKRVDRSVDMTRKLDANEISVQNSPHLDDASIQHEIDARDISLQHVPHYDEIAVQMTKNQQDQSIQCAVLANDVSIQYSAKPIFENISQDFQDSQMLDDEDQAQNSKELNQMPAEDPQVLKAQLQLDVDQKLRRREQEMQLQRQAELQRQKQQMIQKFHIENQNKRKQKQDQIHKNNEIGKLNKLYNNDMSNADGSSLMDSNANIMIHFKNRTNGDNENEEKTKKEGERAQSAKTEKQFIQLLSNKDEGREDMDLSMSFNVTRELEEANDNKIKNVVFEQQDKAVVSDQDNIDIQPQSIRRNREMYILQNDTHQEMPSGFEKSRSTNFLSSAKDGRKPPLPNRTNSNNLMDDETFNMDNSMPQNSQQIIHHPIRSINRNPLSSAYKQEDLDYQPRTNLTQFLNKKKKGPISAYQFSKSNMGEDNEDQVYYHSKQITQNPLVQPKRDTLESQQLIEQNDNGGRMLGKKALVEDKKLQFDEAQKIQFNTQEEQITGGMPKTIRPDKTKSTRSKSQSKMNERSSQLNPIQRQILGKEQHADKPQKYLEKQLRKMQKTKKKMEIMEVMLERPNLASQKGYMRQTHSSQDKKRKSELQKIYLHNPFEKKP